MIIIRESNDRITAKTFDELITKLEKYGYSCGRYYDVEPDSNWLYITKNGDPYEAEFYRYRDGEYELYLNNIHPTREEKGEFKEVLDVENYLEPSKQDLKDLENYISKELDKYSMIISNLDVYTEDDSIIIDILIEWGDWKHDHRRLDYLIQDIIRDYNPNMMPYFGVIGTEITEEDGSDTYSAIHSYGINFDYLYDEK